MKVYEIETRFKEFYQLIESINALITEKDFKSIKQKMLDLNSLIKLIIEMSIDKLKNFGMEPEDSEKIEGNIEEFYASFFNIFANDEDIFSFLFDEISQIYRKRIYQLNHIFGFIENKWGRYLQKNKLLNSFMLANLYLNYYESFALFLNPFIIRLLEEKKPRKIKMNIDSNNIYRFLLPIFFNCSILNSRKGNKNEKDFNWLFDDNFRNIMAHSLYIIDSDNIVINYRISRDFRQKNKYRKVKEIDIKYEFLRNFVVIFTTKLDLEINNKFLKSNNAKIEEYWSDYFKIYFKSWENFKNIMFDEN